MKKIKVISILLIILSSTLIIYNGYNIIKWYKDSYNIKKIKENLEKLTIENNEEVLNNTLVNPPQDKNDIYYSYQNTEFLNIDFTNLLEENTDTVGYITVLGTDVNYPIVKAKDNDYYLDHSFDKTSNKAGWIYLDYRNNLDMLSYNTIIYGHKRKDGTMFGTLKNTLEESWLDNTDNHLIKISTPKMEYIFEIISIYTTLKESYYLTSTFSTMKDYQEFLDTILKRSIYDFKTSLDTNDKLLTLSTCYDGGKRMAIHAKLIKKGIRS